MGRADADAVAQGYRQDVAIAAVQRVSDAARLHPPLDVRPRVWFNADMESRNYIIPGLIAEYNIQAKLIESIFAPNPADPYKEFPWPT